MAAYLPPGWPTGVQPPGSEGFERTAVAWLLDVVPPDYRLYGVLRRHPLALAIMARHHVAACVEGARRGYRNARTELGERLPPPGVDAVLAAYRNEGSRLVATARAVDLLERALRGETFAPQLGAGGQRPRPAGSSRPPAAGAAPQPPAGSVQPPAAEAAPRLPARSVRSPAAGAAPQRATRSRSPAAEAAPQPPAGSVRPPAAGAAPQRARPSRPPAAGRARKC